MYATATFTPDEQPVTPVSRWALRVATFAAALIVAGALSHRFFAMSTPVALNLFKIGFAAAALSFLLVLAAMISIWRHDSRGVLPITGATLIAVTIFAWPVAFIGPMRDLPMLHDVTTDVAAPPAFQAISQFRRSGANPAAHPGAGVARLQSEAYPDIRPIFMERSADEAFELAHHVAVRVFKMQLIAEESPAQRPGAGGRIEAVDRTPVLGFYDDVVIRIVGDQRRARLDIRSSSRYGQHDLGRNASRIRRFLREFQAQLDATVPSSAGERISRLRDRLGKRLAVPRRPQAGDQQKAVPGPGPAPAKSDAQRAPGQKVPLRAKDADRARDTRPAQSPR